MFSHEMQQELNLFLEVRTIPKISKLWNFSGFLPPSIVLASLQFHNLLFEAFVGRRKKEEIDRCYLFLLLIRYLLLFLPCLLQSNHVGMQGGRQAGSLDRSPAICAKKQQSSSS